MELRRRSSLDILRMSGLAIEAATEHVEVVVLGPEGRPLALEIEEVGHGHTRRLTPLVQRALDRAGVSPRELSWVAADLGPGSFTGVRVGLATAQALSMASGGSLTGASSLASLALSSGASRALVIPMIGAGRRDLYAGFFRADVRGVVSLFAAPMVAPISAIVDAVHEALAASSMNGVKFVGPGVRREQDVLERAFPESTHPGWRHEGLSALDLVNAVRTGRGPEAGLPRSGAPLQPLYVRSAQAEERVRRQASLAQATVLRDFLPTDVAAAAELEQRVFSDPWPESFFRGELGTPLVYARVAERDGCLAGYSIAWLGNGSGHLGNLATAPEVRRRGVARLLLEDLLREARVRRVKSLTLEVRVSNFAAQWLYRQHGFRLAGLRRRYYRDTGEDALIMEWRDAAVEP